MNAVATQTQPKSRKTSPASAPAAPVDAQESNAAAPNTDTFASLAYYCSSEAEAVLRTVAENGTNAPESEALWGVMTICGLLLNDMERFHLQPTLGTCENVLCYMDQAIGILNFFDGDLVVNAGGRLLCIASGVAPISRTLSN